VAGDLPQKVKIKMQNDKEKFKKEFKKRLYALTLELIDVIDKLPKDNVSRRLGDQLLRSGTSVIGNYIEAQSASSKKDYTNYFTTSLKSANESKLWLSLLKDTGRLQADSFERLLNELSEISNIFASSILTLKGKK
jgi:four helix bundle protein